jgi:hypothetical protein
LPPPPPPPPLLTAHAPQSVLKKGIGTFQLTNWLFGVVQSVPGCTGAGDAKHVGVFLLPGAAPGMCATFLRTSH